MKLKNRSLCHYWGVDSPHEKNLSTHVYQQTMAYQVGVGLSSSTCIKPGQGNAAWGIGSQIQVTVRISTSRTHYTTVTYIERPHAGFLVVNSDSISSNKPSLVVLVGYLVMSLNSLAPIILPPSLSSSRIPQALPVI